MIPRFSLQLAYVLQRIREREKKSEKKKEDTVINCVSINMCTEINIYNMN